MKSIGRKIKENLDVFDEAISKFLREHVSIYYKKRSIEGFLIIGYSDYNWHELSEDGKRVQTIIYKDLIKFFELINLFLKGQPEKYQKEFKSATKDIKWALLQDGQVWNSNIDEVISKVHSSFDEIKKILNNQYIDNPQGLIIVPDTNALISNIYLDKWNFDEIPAFDIILLPTVLAELDKLKINHRNPDVREKVTKLIRYIKELRRRGKLTEGVTVTSNIKIKAIAVEPNMEDSLSWLDENNDDDRIIASFIEVSREYLNHEIVLVTSDINLQNKAEFSLIDTIEPPTFYEEI